MSSARSEPRRSNPASALTWTRETSGDGASLLQVDRVQGPQFCVGHFRCAARAALWSQENTIGTYHLIAIPHHAVEIAQADRKLVIASPSQAVLYNAGQVYRRAVLDPRGDDCAYFVLPDSIVTEMVAELCGGYVDARMPFRSSWGPLRPQVYLRHRQLLALLRPGASTASDALQVFEMVLEIVQGVLRGAIAVDENWTCARSRGSSATRRRHRELAEAVERELSLRFAENLSLEALASAVGASPYHTARVFRQQTGRTVHDYRLSLRLHSGLERLVDPRTRIADLALSLGFASHSHFSEQFRRAFGRAPSTVRGDLRMRAQRVS